MELRDIRYFAVVAEHQNIGRAAEALDLSATALSKSLRRLEKDVGAKLFERSPKGVVLSPVGAALLRQIGPLQGMLSDVRRECTDLARGYAGHINVGANLSASENFLAQACVTLSRETSRVSFNVTIAVDTVLQAALRRGEMEFCISSPDVFSPAEFVHEDLRDLQDIVVASSYHRLAKRKQVSIQDLAGERWASIGRTSRPQWRPLIEAFQKHGLPAPTLSLRTNSQVLRASAIAYSNYLGVITREFLQQESRRYPLVELPVKEMRLSRSLSIIYRKGAYLSPAANRLVQILKAQANEIQSGARVLRPRRNRTASPE